MKRNVILLVLAGLFITVAAAGLAYWFGVRESASVSNDMTQTNATGDQERAAETGTIRLIATGDTIAHDSVNAQALQTDGSYDYLQMMDQMQPFFEGADIRFCNQATPAGGEEFGISGYPVFNAPFAFTHDMVELGCNLINTGTNHTNDKGQPLIDAMVAEWDTQDVLAHAGANRSQAEMNEIKYFEVKGVTFAFLSYSTYSNSPVSNGYGVTMYSRDLANVQVTEASKQADFVVVSMRWGTEYSPNINDLQNQISQDLADMGADIVFGHGPHVLEPVKRLKGSGGNETIVWYSLGNFLNSQLDVEALTGGIAIMDIDTEKKAVSSASFLPIYMHYEWTAEEKQRQDLLARKNLELYPLDQAAGPLSRSQLNTTIQAQTDRIESVLNQYTNIPIIDSSAY